ncbi:MAG: hypothetical protein RL095_756 [Verrucomicrobiota bacterium]|jgi:hypothetical protein
MNALLLLAALAVAEPAAAAPAEVNAGERQAVAAAELRAEQLIRDYAQGDAAARKEAKAELIKIGPAASASLKKHVDDKDPEVAALAKELLGAPAATNEEKKEEPVNNGEQVIQLGNGGVMRVHGGGNVQFKVIENGVVVAGNGPGQIPPEVLQLMQQRGMPIPAELLDAQAKPAGEAAPLNLGKADPEVQAKVDALLKTISEGDAPARKQAKADLRALGAPAAAALASRSNDKDPEVAAVAKELAQELAPAAGKTTGKDKNGVEIIEGPNGRTVIHRAQRVIVNGQEVDEMPPEMAAQMAAMEARMAAIRAQHAELLKQAGMAELEFDVNEGLIKPAEAKEAPKVESKPADAQAEADRKAAELTKRKAESKP